MSKVEQICIKFSSHSLKIKDMVPEIQNSPLTIRSLVRDMVVGSSKVM